MDQRGDRADAAAEGGGDVGVGEAGVEAEDDGLALAVGEGRQGITQLVGPEVVAPAVRPLLQPPRDRQIALIRAHPDLAGRAAVAGTLTADSAREQSSAGLDRLTPEEYEAFTGANTAYRERFGFPFVICVREHDKDSILASAEARLQNDPDGEIDVALREIAKIAALRLEDRGRSPTAS